MLSFISPNPMHLCTYSLNFSPQGYSYVFISLKTMFSLCYLGSGFSHGIFRRQIELNHFAVSHLI